MATRPFPPFRAAHIGTESRSSEAGARPAGIWGRRSRRKGESRTIRDGARLAVRLLLVGSVWIASTARSDAAPYYTVTSLGNAPDFASDSNLVTQSVTNTQTGITYPFVTTTTTITPDDLKNLPGGTAWLESGEGFPPRVPYTMSVGAINSSGTAIGPSAASRLTAAAMKRTCRTC